MYGIDAAFLRTFVINALFDVSGSKKTNNRHGTKCLATGLFHQKLPRFESKTMNADNRGDDAGISQPQKKVLLDDIYDSLEKNSKGIA
jgi:hypothetical protein